MTKKLYTYETLQAMSADVKVFNNVLQIAHDNIALGMAAAEEGDLDVAKLKVMEICKILESTSTAFINGLVKYRLEIQPSLKN